MLAYGYPRNSTADEPSALSEATLLCTKEELDQIITFLQSIQRKCQNNEMDGFHAHFQDFQENWNNDESDFIICLKDKEI